MAAIDLKAPLTSNLQRLMMFHYSIYHQHPAWILRAQKAEVHQERLFTG
jgi:hypothetical protein